MTPTRSRTHLHMLRCRPVASIQRRDHLQQLGDDMLRHLAFIKLPEETAEPAAVVIHLTLARWCSGSRWQEQ
jgi:hypothetical protein